MDTGEPVGRSALLAVLTHVVSVVEDRGEAVLLFGERGVGKSTCLLKVAELARSAQHLLLATAGTAPEIRLPYAGLHRLLRRLVPAIERLPGVQRRALLTALGLHDGQDIDRFAVSVATLSLLKEACERGPIVVTVDDIHLLDIETRDVLAFVTRRLDQHPVVVVATALSADGLPDFRDLFVEVPLPRLDETAARELLERRAPDLDDGRRTRVIQEAAGNPLALVELARTGALIDARVDPTGTSQLPPTLERAFAGNVRDLPITSRDAVLVASVSSDENLSEILAATALLGESSVTAAVLEAPRAMGLLEFDELSVRFAHPLAKVAIAQTESVSRCQAAHRALGAVITVNSLRGAWHRALGTDGHDDETAAELEAAATSDSARPVNTPTVIAALERAARLSKDPAERGRRLLLAAGQAARLGQSEVVVRLLGAVAGLDLSLFDRARAELLGEDLGGVVIGDSNRIIHLCSAARRAAAAGEPELALDLAYAAGRRRWAVPVDARALAELSSLSEALVAEFGDARATALLALADPVGQGRRVLRMLADVDEESGIDADALSVYAVASRSVGDYARALRLLDRAEIDLRAGGLLGPLARNLCLAADLRLELGQWERAASALTDLRSLATASRSTNYRIAVLTANAKLLALGRDPLAGLELIAKAEQTPEARTGSSHLARAQIVRGIGLISAGKHHEAVQTLRRVFEPDDPCHHAREQFDALGYLAEAAARSGRPDQARDVVDRMQLIADESGSPILAMQLSYARAVLAPDDVAEQLFLACLASETASSPWLRARVQLAYGQWLRRQQLVRQSRQPLQAALAVFVRIGATKWAEDALNEIRATGAQGDDERTGATGGVLSTQELRIARLAAQGLSNREIGQQLYISPRTVGSHLYRIFPKLGVTTRGQIASRLADDLSSC